MTWTKGRQAAGSMYQMSSGSASAYSAMPCALRCELPCKLHLSTEACVLFELIAA